jgi:hypothetical protein
MPTRLLVELPALGYFQSKHIQLNVTSVHYFEIIRTGQANDWLGTAEGVQRWGPKIRNVDGKLVVSVESANPFVVSGSLTPSGVRGQSYPSV